jgi:hypothetical protein
VTKTATIASDMATQPLCATCHKPYVPATYWQRHCSKTCRRTAIMRTYRAKIKTSKNKPKGKA